MASHLLQFKVWRSNSAMSKKRKLSATASVPRKKSKTSLEEEPRSVNSHKAEIMRGHSLHAHLMLISTNLVHQGGRLFSSLVPRPKQPLWIASTIYTQSGNETGHSHQGVVTPISTAYLELQQGIVTPYTVDVGVAYSITFKKAQSQGYWKFCNVFTGCGPGRCFKYMYMYSAYCSDCPLSSPLTPPPSTLSSPIPPLSLSSPPLLSPLLPPSPHCHSPWQM